MRARTRPTSRNDQSIPSATSRVSLSRSNSALLSIAWGFVEIPLATLAGAWAYHEE